MENELYQFITYIKVQTNLVDETREALKALAEHNLSDPSCLRCEAYQVTHKTHNFIVTEQWESIEAYQSHVARAKDSELYDRIIIQLSALLDTQELTPC